MTKSARRAKKKRVAQEALQGKEGTRCGEPMDPLDLSGPETDQKKQKPRGPARTREPEELVTHQGGLKKLSIVTLSIW